MVKVTFELRQKVISIVAMNQFTPFIFILFLYSFFAYPIGLDAQVLSERIANYTIDLELDTDNKTVNARQKISFKNISTDTIKELQFHLYYNAFKNTESTFYQDQDGVSPFGNFESKEECTWSWIKIEEFKNAAGVDLSSNMDFIAPDDGNENDETVLRILLNDYILPGVKRTFDLKWQSKIPNIRPRTGYNKDFYHFVQWFPKLGVYEMAGMRGRKEGGWNCHQYHASGEYYADFGNYEVTMDVPNTYKVGASGVMVEKKVEGDRSKWTFKVSDVIDFAWTCSPRFIEFNDTWQDVDLKILTYDDHEACAEKYFNILQKGLSYLDEHVGKYPYPTLTLIDPPLHGLFTGGMEYPTLITSINLCFLPAGFKTTETLTTHELIHQYFMQMVATHEVEEPWLDEGFTTYYEGRILDSYLGEKTSFLDWRGWRVGNGEYNRGEFFAMDNPKLAPSSIKSWEFKHGGYSPISYNKTAIWMKTLERMIGVEVMDEIMRTYFERWKFKHPSGKDFEKVANEVVLKNHGEKFGANLNWFFDQVIRGTEICDYKLASITNKKIPKPSGYLNSTEDCVNTDFENEDYKLSRVILHRVGELKMPVDIDITFADGTVKTEYWDGISRSIDFSYRGQNEIVSAEIDPERKIYLDRNFLNNSLSVTHQRKGLLFHFHEFLRAAQNILQTLTIVI